MDTTLHDVVRDLLGERVDDEFGRLAGVVDAEGARLAEFRRRAGDIAARLAGIAGDYLDADDAGRDRLLAERMRLREERDLLPAVIAAQEGREAAADLACLRHVRGLVAAEEAREREALREAERAQEASRLASYAARHGDASAGDATAGGAFQEATSAMLARRERHHRVYRLLRAVDNTILRRHGTDTGRVTTRPLAA